MSDSTAKHSEGPWTAEAAPHGPVDIFDANGHDIVTVYGSNRVGNARLMAASFCLLADAKALRAAQAAYMADRGNNDLGKAVAAAAAKLDATIAKAEGR